MISAQENKKKRDEPMARLSLHPDAHVYSRIYGIHKGVHTGATGSSLRRERNMFFPRFWQVLDSRPGAASSDNRYRGLQ